MMSSIRTYANLLEGRFATRYVKARALVARVARIFQFFNKMYKIVEDRIWDHSLVKRIGMSRPFLSYSAFICHLRIPATRVEYEIIFH